MTTTTAAVEWELWSTRARLVVTDPGVLSSARELVDSYLAQVDDAANRFRGDSEICRLVERSGEVTLSPTMAHLVAEALAAAELTDGDVDPTVGGALRRLGYDRDLRLVTGDAGPLRAVIRPVPGYRSLRLQGSRLRLPAGVELDLGATAKAVAADRAAALVHGAFGTGVLVSLGGDIATAGPAPATGWQVHVQDRDEDPWTQVELPAGSAIATSSTVSRRWRARRPHDAPHRRPPHRPAGPAVLAQRHRGGRHLRARQRGHDRLAGPRGAGRRLGPRPRPAGPLPAPRRRARAHRRLADGAGGMNLTEALWYLGRGTGLVALVMFTVTMVLGITTRSGRAGLGLNRFGLADLHKTASLAGTGLIAVHVGTLLFDPYAQLRLVDLASRSWRRTGRCGWASARSRSTCSSCWSPRSLLRHRVGPRVFRAVHWTAYAMWPLALVHALGTGTDAGTVWMRAVAATCVLAVAAAVGWRTSGAFAERGKRRIPRRLPTRKAVTR